MPLVEFDVLFPLVSVEFSGVCLLAVFVLLVINFDQPLTFGLVVLSLVAPLGNPFLLLVVDNFSVLRLGENSLLLCKELPVNMDISDRSYLAGR